jgi:SAM-dependent methyltransferase
MWAAASAIGASCWRPSYPRRRGSRVSIESPRGFRRQRHGRSSEGSAIDFHIGAARRRGYRFRTTRLTSRPARLLLIHLPDPGAAIAEMLRVTRPGGLVAVAEPNNLAEPLLLDSISSQASIEDTAELVRLQLTCERGKVALGEGDNSLGDRVPGLFVALGLTEVEAYCNDKATAIFAPYAAGKQRAFTEDARNRAARRLWNWSEAETRGFFLAGGGAEADFTGHFERGLAAREKIVRGLDDRTYRGVLGGALYLVSGRKRPSHFARGERFVRSSAISSCAASASGSSAYMCQTCHIPSHTLSSA